MSAGSEAIAIRDLTERYGQRLAVDRLSSPCRREASPGSSVRTARARRRRCGYSSASPASSGDAHILGGPYGSLDAPLRRVGAALETTGFHPGRDRPQPPPDPRLFDHLAAGALMVLYVASATALAVWLERRRDV